MTPEQQAELLVRIDERVKSTHDLIKAHIAADDKVHEELRTKTSKNRNWLTAITFGGLTAGGGATFWEQITSMFG